METAKQQVKHRFYSPNKKKSQTNKPKAQKMKKINEAFVCAHCGKDVPRAVKTCRNHCPWCFCSLHVDENLPGDRASLCQGKAFPFEYEYVSGDRKISFMCSKCGKVHRNKSAFDDEITLLPALIKSYVPFLESFFDTDTP